MAALPPVAQIAGQHIKLYESLFRQVDLKSSGRIPALEAAAYLKKSGIAEDVLSQIWDLCDPTGKGYLDREAFFASLKLIALAQNGKEIDLRGLTIPVPMPNMNAAASSPVTVSSVGGDNSWIPAAEKNKYDQIFDGLGPVNGILSGDKVKPVLVNSKLPVDVLSRVWDLSDIDGDGFLDRDEFAVAMHLVYKALEKEPVPMKLPPNLIPPSKRVPRKGSVITGGVPVLPAIPAAAGAGSGRSSPALVSSPAHKGSMPAAGITWLISPAEQAKYDEIFRQADADKDGFVNGAEIKNIFIQSRVPQPVLAHIWSLCDMNNTGKLNTEQFALAMYLVQQKVKGIDPPPSLPPDMIPPSMRTGTNFPYPDLGGASIAVGAAGFSEISMKELDMISKEIDDLKRDKMVLEQEKAQSGADIRIRNGEVGIIQKELDAINSTLKQLETQKGEAQKKLDELDDKRRKLESAIEGMKEKCDEEQKTIASLRSQISNQDAYAKNQEEELKSKRDELAEMRQEELELEQEVEKKQSSLDQITKSLDDMQAQINQAMALIKQHTDNKLTMETNIGQYSALINGEEGAVEPGVLSMTPVSFSNDMDSTRATASSTPASTFSSVSYADDRSNKDDPFKGRDPFSAANGDADPFSSEDPFKNTDDPFKGTDPFQNEGSFDVDPFAGEAFGDSFGQKQNAGFGAAQNSDPFGGGGGFDAFGSKKVEPKKDLDLFEAAFSGVRPTGTSAKNDPFAPAGNVTDIKSPMMAPGADPFGADPFLPVNKAPPGRPSSPSPALRGISPTPLSQQSKQKKAPPPPRPAPPRPAHSPMPQTSPSPVDAFGSSDPFGSDGFGKKTDSNGADPFANFAEFSPSKFPGATTEDAQMAWAQRESEEAERERQRRLAEQEKADLELALALSRHEAGSSEA